MRTNIMVDALKLTGIKSKREALEQGALNPAGIKRTGKRCAVREGNLEQMRNANHLIRPSKQKCIH